MFKFSSCDGCQLSLLDCEDELLEVAHAVDIAYFLEATTSHKAGPYDICLVEGSVATEHDIKRLERIRKRSRILVALGACATSGGLQALRNLAALSEFTSEVYPHPDYISSLPDSSPLSEYVKVDAELRGCPVSKAQLLEAVAALVQGRQPFLPTGAVLPAMQAGRHHLPHGRRRRALHGPGHPGGLRGALPQLRPALLWLLRAQGSGQPRRPVRLVQKPPGPD